MLFSTPTQFAVLALLLIAGWLFGLASHPGGRKWKDRYVAERDAHATMRKDLEARLAEANGRIATLESAPVAVAPDHDARVTELERENARLSAVDRGIGNRSTDVDARIGELERENDRLRNERTGIRVARRNRPVTDDQQRGWFDWNRSS